MQMDNPSGKKLPMTRANGPGQFIQSFCDSANHDQQDKAIYFGIMAVFRILFIFWVCGESVN